MSIVIGEHQTAQSSISPENYSFLQRYIYQESGIVIDAGKNYLLESRLLPIVKQEKLTTLNDLCNLLRATAPVGLRSRVVESMTTNETLFFRDLPIFEALQQHILPKLVESRRDTKRISIWSAAASSGQEAYSIAMLLQEMRLEGWRIQILGTDLNQQILDKAASGRYLQIEVNRGLPAKYLVKHFTRVGLDWQISFCRNVLIYFDVETKRKILASLRQAMVPEALLALGAAETTINLDNNFQRVTFGSAAFYQVP